MLSTSQHIVIPGQVIATSSNQDEEQSFLRGHGTYLENVLNTNTDHDNNNNNHDTNIDSSYNYNDKHTTEIAGLTITVNEYKGKMDSIKHIIGIESIKT